MTTPEKHLNKKWIMATASVLGVVLLAVMVVSAFTFMVFTAANMLLNKQSRQFFGEELPAGYKPIRYKFKGSKTGGISYLWLDNSAKEYSLVAFSINGKETHKAWEETNLKALFNLAESRMEEYVFDADYEWWLMQEGSIQINAKNLQYFDYILASEQTETPVVIMVMAPPDEAEPLLIINLMGKEIDQPDDSYNFKQEFDNLETELNKIVTTTKLLEKENTILDYESK